jgi:hypothetical protein
LLSRVCSLIKTGNKSIILEAITNQRLRIWHAYFNLPRGNNDFESFRYEPFDSRFIGEVQVSTFNFEVMAMYIFVTTCL